MDLKLVIDLHKSNSRQGPGSIKATKLAIEMSGLGDKQNKLKIVDIGCGSGASTLTICENLNADITAVDLFPEFLEILEDRATEKGLNKKIKTTPCSMDDLPFDENSLDAVWSEGAIYNIGFKKGIEYFKRFLKPKGILAVSEITWLTNNRPEELTSHWESEYPEIDTVSNKIKIIEESGFTLKGYFPLPEECWLSNYYEPLQNKFEDFLKKHNSDGAKSIIEAEVNEIELYKKYRNYYSYGFYIAQKG